MQIAVLRIDLGKNSCSIVEPQHCPGELSLRGACVAAAHGSAVITLLLLPRFGLLGWDAGGQRVEPLMSVLKLTVDETDTGNERGKWALAASIVPAAT
jgi:hypothetical protein